MTGKERKHGYFLDYGYSVLGGDDCNASGLVGEKSERKSIQKLKFRLPYNFLIFIVLYFYIFVIGKNVASPPKPSVKLK